MVVDELVLQRLARERRFDARTLEIARRLFLLGEKPRKVAKEFALIDKRVYAIRSEVVRHVQRYQLPDGWSELTLQGPVEVLKATQAYFDRRMEARAQVPGKERAATTPISTARPSASRVRTTRS